MLLRASGAKTAFVDVYDGRGSQRIVGRRHRPHGGTKNDGNEQSNEANGQIVEHKTQKNVVNIAGVAAGIIFFNECHHVLFYGFDGLVVGLHLGLVTHCRGLIVLVNGSLQGRSHLDFLLR